jgi:hypothetical protein
MSNPLRLTGIVLCVVGIALFIFAIATRSYDWYPPSSAFSSAGAVALIFANRRSRPT